MKRGISLLILILNFGIISAYSQKRILFDNTKSEQAGNADWVIDDGTSQYPTPSQSGITSSTPETYWSGALSSWGVALAKRGYTVETLPPNGNITYGDNSNPQDLSNYDVFIVDEPNNPFSASEKQALLNFVDNGGGLFIISDHAGADRDGDGYDALQVWNDFFSDYNNPFGFYFDSGSDISNDPATNIPNLPTNPILHGISGDVEGLAFHDGATITLDHTHNTSSIGLVFDDGYSNTGTTGVMAVCATYGNGRIVGLGDSSVPEDDTPNGGTTHPGWVQPSGSVATADDSTFCMNATIWLANSNNEPSLFVSTSTLSNFSYAPGYGPSSSKNFTLSGSNLDGSEVNISASSYYEISLDNSNFTSSLNISYNPPTLSNTIIYVRLKSGLSLGNYSGSVTCSDNGSATDKIVNLTGEVSNELTILNEDFSACPPENWTIYSVNSNKNWECNNGVMEINGYNGDVASNDWLISPALDLSNTSSAILSFDTWTQYSDNLSDPELKVYYSVNYSGSGNPLNATWNELNYNYPADNSQSWTNSGNIDLSGINSNNLYIAFQYISSGTSAGSSSYWKLDNVQVSANFSANKPIKNSKNQLSIYPNPVIGNQLTIFTGNSLKKTITISNIDGETIKTEYFSDKQKIIDLKNLKSGIYFIKVIMNKTVKVRKIIVL